MAPYSCVMLIDDNEIDNIINEKIIEANQFADRILIFQTGQEALDYLAEQAQQADELPEIVFLDINMPIMDGFQFLDEFEKMPESVTSKCKVIMLSSSISPRDIDRAASRKHVKKYLNKPLNSRYLEAIVI